MCWRQVRARKLLLALGVVALLAVACAPIPHPDFVVREGPTSPVTFELLSGDGNYVVVRSTGPSATVPGAGRWRVDRRDNSVVALPSSVRSEKISRDGSRVLLSTSSPNSILWSSGTTLTPPAGTQFSDDLTFGVFVDTDGAVKTWKTATQAVGLVETGFPRPAGTTRAIAQGISDDGRTVQYTLGHSEYVERFVDLDTHQLVDEPSNNGGGDTDSYTDRFVLAASGNGFVHTHEVAFIDVEAGESVLQESWSELVGLPTGAVLQRYTNTTNEPISRELISANGRRAWTYQSRTDMNGENPDCPAIGTHWCVVASHAVVFWDGTASRSFDLGAGALGSIDSSPDGRFLLIDKEQVPAYDGVFPKGPVRILDVYAPGETLDQSQSYLETLSGIKCVMFGFPWTPCTVPGLSAGAHVSNDLRVVVTTTDTGKGWYEYSTAP